MTLPLSPLPALPVFLPRRPYAGQVQFVLPYTQQETVEFLEDNSDLEDSLMLWEAKSGVRGLLNATLTGMKHMQQNTVKFHSNRSLVETFFDFAQGIYRYLIFGRKVPTSRVRLGVLRVSRAQSDAMRQLTIRLVNGEVSQEYWYKSMRKLMKDQYRASYIASIGGVDNYTRSEVSRFGWKVRPHYRWLDNFLMELNTGKQPMNGFAVSRSGMYARAGNGIYQGSLFSIAERNGMTMAKRVLSANDDHCHDGATRPGCVEQAARGFVPMSQAVQIGGCQCYSNCLCVWSFK